MAFCGRMLALALSRGDTVFHNLMLRVWSAPRESHRSENSSLWPYRVSVISLIMPLLHPHLAHRNIGGYLEIVQDSASTDSMLNLKTSARYRSKPLLYHSMSILGLFRYHARLLQFCLRGHPINMSNLSARRALLLPHFQLQDQAPIRVEPPRSPPEASLEA